MSRIAFAIVVFLAVISLEIKLHSSARWVTFCLLSEDAEYLESSGATFKQYGRTFALKMDATGVECLHNLRDCEALRVKMDQENLENDSLARSSGRLPSVYRKVVRENGRYSIVEYLSSWTEDTNEDNFPSRLINQVAVDEALLSIGTPYLANLNKTVARYESDSALDWVKP